MTNLPYLETIGSEDRPTGELYLRLKLQNSIVAAIRLESVREVLSVPSEHITPIPFMPECTFGLIEKRSRIIWVVDLPQMLELKPLERNRRLYGLAIIKNGNSSLAVAVEAIESVFRFESESIVSPDDSLAPGLVPYVRGCITEAEKVIWVLEPNSIINSPLLGGDLSLSRNAVSI
jgi:positive phototaxis protein PixI